MKEKHSAAAPTAGLHFTRAHGCHQTKGAAVAAVELGVRYLPSGGGRPRAA
ncbi:MAG: hypothetical protein ACLRM9_07625 [Collinsella aerofaciens]